MSQSRYATKEWKAVRKQVFERDGQQCQRCGRTAGLQAHHVIRPKEGGKDELINLVTLCAECHEEYTWSHQHWFGDATAEYATFTRWLTTLVSPADILRAEFEHGRDKEWAEDVTISYFWGSWPEWADRKRELFSNLNLIEAAEQAGVMKYIADKEERELAFYRKAIEEWTPGMVVLSGPPNLAEKLGMVGVEPEEAA